jgi:hypothetical protein
MPRISKENTISDNIWNRHISNICKKASKTMTSLTCKLSFEHQFKTTIEIHHICATTTKFWDINIQANIQKLESIKFCHRYLQLHRLLYLTSWLLLHRQCAKFKITCTMFFLWINLGFFLDSLYEGWLEPYIKGSWLGMSLFCPTIPRLFTTMH